MPKSSLSGTSRRPRTRIEETALPIPQPAITIALLPLDERPVNTRYPQMLGAIAGAEVRLPPQAIRGRQRDPADAEAVAAWLREAAAQADAVVASAEFLLYGNLINSRISDESASDVLPRLKALEEIGARGTPVYAFSLLTRVANADNAVEEPLYWAHWGTRLYRYSGLLHKRDAGALGENDAAALLALEAEIPPDLAAEWLRRRLRNHAVNLALLDLLARERLDLLLLTSDDTSPWGMPSREKAWLEGWVGLLGPRVAERMLVHPGADEVGSALVARLLCRRRGQGPRICPVYAVPGGEEIVAPYEDRAVWITVEGQIRACGCVSVPSPEEADIVLGVLTPSPRRTEFRDDFAEAEKAERAPFYAAFFARLAAWQQRNKPVALADVAYPNGADPLAVEMLLAPASPLAPADLAAFGAWNTAGNTLGVVVAQAVCALLIEGDPRRERAQAAFLAHRFLEDWGYQSVVRREARAHLESAWGRRDPDPKSEEQIDAARAAIESGLARALERLQARGIGAGLRLAPGSVRLPWRRTFEVDFDLETQRSNDDHGG